jgi:hypothetical protein
VPRRWFLAVASAVVALAVVVALALGAMSGTSQSPSSPGPSVLSVCGAYLLPNGNCVGIPAPEDSGATCAPQPEGPCSWVWKSPYPTH